MFIRNIGNKNIKFWILPCLLFSSEAVSLIFIYGFDITQEIAKLLKNWQPKKSATISYDCNKNKNIYERKKA